MKPWPDNKNEYLSFDDIFEPLSKLGSKLVRDKSMKNIFKYDGYKLGKRTVNRSYNIDRIRSSTIYEDRLYNFFFFCYNLGAEQGFRLGVSFESRPSSNTIHRHLDILKETSVVLSKQERFSESIMLIQAFKEYKKSFNHYRPSGWPEEFKVLKSIKRFHNFALEVLKDSRIKKDIKYHGPKLGVMEAAVSLSGEHIGSIESRRFQKDNNGRSSMHLLVCYAIQLGIEAGRRMYFKEVMKKHDECLEIIKRDSGDNQISQDVAKEISEELNNLYKQLEDS